MEHMSDASRAKHVQLVWHCHDSNLECVMFCLLSNIEQTADHHRAHTESFASCKDAGLKVVLGTSLKTSVFAQDTSQQQLTMQ